MTDLSDQYKFVREDELKNALKNVLNYCKYDTCVDLQTSVKIIEEYLEGKSIKNEK
jgi:hypothetical protein